MLYRIISLFPIVTMQRYIINWYSIGLLFLVTNTVKNLDNTSLVDILGNYALTPLQLAKKYGYPMERHSVTTEDGYILNVYRVPYGVNSTDRSNRPPVIFGHGSGGNSVEFLMMGHRSIGFSLVEAGYDLWLSNARGTWWSRRHKTLSVRSKQFWMFSWEEIGVYDYRAIANYAINISGQEKVFFITHSSAGSSFMAMASERPEMNDKVRLAVLISPTIFVTNNRNTLLLTISENIKAVQGFFDYLHIYELPSGPTVTNFINIFCRSVLSFLCSAFLNIIMGYDRQIDRRLLQVGISNLPGGLSVRQMVHFAQIFNTGRFQKYDYGPEENIKHYDSVQPPLYDIGKVTAPVALMYSKDDPFMDARDAQDLVNALPNCAFHYVIEKDMWNHIAYLVANDAEKLVNQKIIEMMSQY